MATVTTENITDLAVRRWSTAHPPRLAELMTAVVRHLHDLAREVRLTEDELMAAVRWLTAERPELMQASDVLGVSMLVVQLNTRSSPRATPSTVLGPFHVDGSPAAPFGFDMSQGLPGTPLFLTGRLLDLDGDPLPNVVLEVWHADADGNYRSRLSSTGDARLRAKYRSREDGTYCIRTIAPNGYEILTDGPVRDLVRATEISPFRPAHVHFLIEHPGHERLVTQVFRQGAQFLENDVVFGTEDELVVPFVEMPPGASPDGGTMDTPYLHAEYDFVLQPRAGAGQ